MARDISFRPRLEMGVMQYEFESEAFSTTVMPVHNKTFSAFKYEDVMPFASGGATFFINRFFLDISGQYAFDGNDSGTTTRSAFTVDSIDGRSVNYTSSYMALSPKNDVIFDRTDMAVSLGYALSSTFSLFVGYKTSRTEFHETFDGPYSLILYDTADSDPDNRDYIRGRLRGEAKYNFEYAGPFIGFIQGWDFNESRFPKGVLSVNVALAFLEGKLKKEGDKGHWSIIWVNDQQIPERVLTETDTNISSREDTKGDALGLKVGLAWNGATPWEGLSYEFGISAYRYEFDADEKLSNMNETAANLKVGLSYVF
jgi:hypothetical protein